jgi:hypothetical protein
VHNEALQGHIQPAVLPRFDFACVICDLPTILCNILTLAKRRPYPTLALQSQSHPF